jgi:hypothetical protein
MLFGRLVAEHSEAKSFQDTVVMTSSPCIGGPRSMGRSRDCGFNVFTVQIDPIRVKGGGNVQSRQKSKQHSLVFRFFIPVLPLSASRKNKGGSNMSCWFENLNCKISKAELGTSRRVAPAASHGDRTFAIVDNLVHPRIPHAFFTLILSSRTAVSFHIITA